MRVESLQNETIIVEFLQELHCVHESLRPDFFKPFQEGIVKQMVIEAIASDNEFFYGIKIDEEFVAMIWFSQYPARENEWNKKEASIQIDALVTKKEFRGQHLANMLMQFIEEFALENGVKLLTLNCYAGNDAEKFYQKVGYTPSNITMIKKLTE